MLLHSLQAIDESAVFNVMAQVRFQLLTDLYLALYPRNFSLATIFHVFKLISLLIFHLVSELELLVILGLEEQLQRLT